MTVRSGMENLIVRLRGMTEAGESDYSLAGVTYWTGEQVQDVLDRHRTDIVREPLTAEPEFVAVSDQETHNYYTGHRNLEEAASGTPVWDIEDGTGASLGTAAYTVNYEAGHIRVAADTLGASYYLTARAYNLNRAAAAMWEMKASHAVKGYDFSADGATFHRSQVYDHCMKMAQHYKGMGGMRVGRLFRDDVNASWL